MADFGKSKPRSMESFGVAGLLGEEAKVFYSSVFTTRHLGRVSDLLAARLQQNGLDELKLRALLLFGAFEVFRSQVSEPQQASSHHLGDPLVIECGLDADRVAVGVSFHVAEARFPRLEGLEQRVSQGKPEGDFETLLQELQRHSSQLIIRAQKSVGRIELIALMGIGAAQAKLALHVVSLDEKPVQEAPKVQAYIELGDLDYPALLKEDAPGAGAPPPATGEVLVKGSAPEDPELRRIRGSGANGNSDVIRVSGGRVSSDQGDDVIRVKGGAGHQGEAGSNNFVVKDNSSDVESGTGKGLLNKLKGAWPLKKPTSEDGKEVEPQAADAPSEPSVAVATADVTPAAEAPAADALPAADETAPEVKKEASPEETDIEKVADDFDKTVDKVQQEVDEIKPDLATARTKRWVEGLMSDLVAEKARIHEMAHKLSTSIRQKEFEFKQKEQALREELRRKDDLLKQKDNALERSKEQLAQLSSNSTERGKSSKIGGNDEAHYKQRYALVQKMLSSSKDENSTLITKIDDLKSQLMTAQLGSSKRNQPSAADYSALQTKYEHALKQSDDFKKAYQQMADKLGEVKKERISGNTDETKKRLERAMQMVTNHQKENERLQIKIEEMQREQMRLQGDLNKSAAELKAAAKIAAKAGTPDTKPGSVAPAKPGPVAAVKPGAAKPVAGGSGNKGNPPKAA